MELREFSYLIELEKTGSITKAANNLFLTQPALSKALKKMEADIGGPIFYRDGNSLVPTDLGTIVLRYAHSITDEHQQMQEELRMRLDPQRHTVRLGLPFGSSFFLSRFMEDFSCAHSDIRLECTIDGGVKLTEQLEKGDLDFAFLLPEQRVNMYLKTIPVIHSEFAAGVPEGHPWLEKEYIENADFGTSRVICYTDNAQSTHVLIDRLREAGVRLNPAMQSDDISWMIEYARNSKLPCILPRFVLENFAGQKLTIKGMRPALPWDLNLSYIRSLSPSQVERIFLNFVSSYPFLKDH